mmetsp:Transcript_18059/g.48581  ORF Transcript_18059/g.48581 Transcript_18059/m.48581 type:complete len:240 (+) Transcript_18059:560-1279(+)
MTARRHTLRFLSCSASLCARVRRLVSSTRRFADAASRALASSALTWKNSSGRSKAALETPAGTRSTRMSRSSTGAPRALRCTHAGVTTAPGSEPPPPPGEALAAGGGAGAACCLGTAATTSSRACASWPVALACASYSRNSPVASGAKPAAISTASAAGVASIISAMRALVLRMRWYLASAGSAARLPRSLLSRTRLLSRAAGGAPSMAASASSAVVAGPSAPVEGRALGSPRVGASNA